MPNGYYGPSYRRSAIWGEQEQRKAMGMPPMTPAATAAAVRGELEPYYAFQTTEREAERRAGFEERRLGIAEEETAAQEKAGTISGITQMGLTGAALYKSGLPQAIYGGVEKAGTAAGLWGGTTGLLAGQTAPAALAGTATGIAGIATEAAAAEVGWAAPAAAEAGGGILSSIWTGLLALLACPISTAAVLHLGKTDDCIELKTLRWFRDNVLKFLPGGKEDIETYYRIAPEIVKRLNKKADAHQTYKQLWNKFIYPAVMMIWQGKYREAHKTYKDMMIALG
jgi:hypothetical protein